MAIGVLTRPVSSLHCLKSFPSFASPLTRNMITDWKQNFLVTKPLCVFVCLAFRLTPVFRRRTQTSEQKQKRKKKQTNKARNTGLRRLRTALFRHIQGESSGVGLGISIDLSLNNDGIIMVSRVKSLWIYSILASTIARIISWVKRSIVLWHLWNVSQRHILAMNLISWSLFSFWLDCFMANYFLMNENHVHILSWCLLCFYRRWQILDGSLEGHLHE